MPLSHRDMLARDPRDVLTDAERVEVPQTAATLRALAVECEAIAAALDAARTVGDILAVGERIESMGSNLKVD